MKNSSDPMSFDDLGAVYRTEKKSPSLSAVRKDLYQAMAGLIINLKTEYEKHLSTDPDSIICEGVNQRRKKAVSLSKEIAEIRMEKIASMALRGARGAQNALDHLTLEEKAYYEEVLASSKKQVGLMDKLSGRKKYETQEIDPEPVVKKKAPEPVRVSPEPEEAPETVIEEEIIIDEIPAEVPEAPKEVPDDDLVVIRILEDLPPFSGPDRNYELSKEDIVRMPKAMALALVNREKAVMINPGP
jgi:DNA replication factor GINS